MKQFAFLSAIAHSCTPQAARANFLILDRLSKDENLSAETRTAINFALKIIYKLMDLPSDSKLKVLEFLRRKNEEF